MRANRWFGLAYLRLPAAGAAPALAIGCPRGADGRSCDECDECDDDDATAPECVEDDGCAGHEICDGGVCVEGERNNGLDEAVLLTPDAGYAGLINPVGDVDHFLVQADAGGTDPWYGVFAVVE